MATAVGRYIKSIKERDPAARNGFQIVLLYSGVHALIHYRIAHFFYKIHFYFIIKQKTQQKLFQTTMNSFLNEKYFHQLMKFYADSNESKI